MSNSSETGWLPDCVYTGGKFESGLAFFADGLGRIVRFSREPGDLAKARRLAGQAALPGLVNSHSHAFHRVLRGRTEGGAKSPGAASGWSGELNRVAGRLSDEDVYDAARMAFLEMLLSGATCVGEFNALERPESAGRILRAAHDLGMRISLIQAASGRADRFIAETEALRVSAGKDYPADEAWLGVGALSLSAVRMDTLKEMAGYAHAQRMRLHVQVSERASDNEACSAEYRRTPVAALAEQGLLGKRFMAIHAIHISDDEARLLGEAKATVCVCPVSERGAGLGAAPVERLLEGGAAICFGTDSQVQADLLSDARAVSRPGFGPGPAGPLFHAATAAGARGLGAPGGALEVGRPADFFTVNLFNPSVAGAEPGALLENIVFSLERRAIREVWVGARQRTANGRHPDQGAIVSKFAELQRRLWAGR